MEKKAKELHHRPPTALEIGELYVAGLKREKLLEEDNAQKDQVIEEQKQEAKKNQPFRPINGCIKRTIKHNLLFQ